MSLEFVLAYILATVVFALIPGPMVTLIIANSLRHGTRAGLLNVAGAQLGLAIMIAVLVVGLASVIAFMGVWFDWLRFLGAAYLIWIGWKLLRHPGALGETAAAPAPRGGFFLQGFLVVMSNPKALLFFGAFIPQFVDPTGDYVGQVIRLGGIAMAVAAVSDSAWAVLTGQARRLLSGPRVKLVSWLSGAMLIGGGAWLALARPR